MDTLFRQKKQRSSASSQASQHLTSPPAFHASLPYSQLPSLNPLPFAGPSTSTLSLVNGSRSRISLPDTNPDFNDGGSPYKLGQRRSDASVPPPSVTRKSSRISRTLNLLDDGRDSGNESARLVNLDGRFSAGSYYVPPSVSPESGTTNGPRYQPPSVTLGMAGTSPPDFPQQSSHRHPYAQSAYRDPDTTSVRSVSSVNSAQAPNRDFGRYPSFAQSTTSLSSRQSTLSSRGPGPDGMSPVPGMGSGVAGSRLSEEFSFARPADIEVESLFQQLVENRDLDSTVHIPSISTRNTVTSASQVSIAKTAASLPIATKWQMVESDARARWETEKAMRKKEDELLRTGKVGKRGTAGVHVKNSPEWFLKKVLDGTLTVQLLATLNVSLRTFPLE